MSQPDKCALLPIIITVVSWPVTAYIGYLFGRRSQRLLSEEAASAAARSRMREFSAFMDKWKAEVGQHFSYGEFAVAYAKKVPDFREAASLIRDDIPKSNRARFKKLVDTASGFSGAHADDAKTGKQRISEAIDAVITFTHDT